MLTAILFSGMSFLLKDASSTFAALSTTFATLTGAILVFSTLRQQQKSLDEEIKRNEQLRFDSRFYNILSSFRMDAANMEIIWDYIQQKGTGQGREAEMTYKGDKAFFVVQYIYETLQNSISDDTFHEYDENILAYELNEVRKKEESIDEYIFCVEELDAIEEEKVNCINAYQAPYLLHKYGITKRVWEKMRVIDEEAKENHLLRGIIYHQPTILAKYIQSLRYIVHVIEGLPNASDKKDYYLNISCLLGKQEQKFLSKFKEFYKIATINA